MNFFPDEHCKVHVIFRNVPHNIVMRHYIVHVPKCIMTK